MSLHLFGEKIHDILKEKKWSQQKLADLVEVTQQTVSRWINGTREPDFDTLLRICYILKEEPNELLGFNDLTKEDYSDYEWYEQTKIQNYKLNQEQLDEEQTMQEEIEDEEEEKRQKELQEILGEDYK